MRRRMIFLNFVAFGFLVTVVGGLSAVCILCNFSIAVGVVSGSMSILMFLIYVIGRIWSISQCRGAYSDKIYIPSHDVKFDDDGFVDPSGLPMDMFISDMLDLSEDGIGELFMVTSVDGIYDLHVNVLVYDDDLNISGRKIVSKNISFVNPFHSVCIRAVVPDVIARYEVEFYTYDYKCVKAGLYTSLRDGSFAGGIDVSFGWRFFCYRFFGV